MINKIKFYLKKLFSNFKESEKSATDKLLKKYALRFRNKAVILVIGANNGIENDPYTKWIIKNKWTAYLVEPVPFVFEQLEKNFKEFPNVHCINKAISKSSKKIKLYKIAFSEKRWATGLTSFSPSIIKKHITNGYVMEMAKKYSDQLPKYKKDYINKIEVGAIKASHLIKQLQLKKVNIIAIDTEGLDFWIIKDLIKNRIFPDIFCWEHLHMSKNKRNQLQKNLKALGYESWCDQNNYVSFRKKLGL